MDVRRPLARPMVNILGRQLQTSTFVTEIRFFAWGFEQIACVFFPSCVPVLCFYSTLSLSPFASNIPSMDEVLLKILQKVEDGKMMVKLLIKYWCTPARRRLKETRTRGTAAALALISASVSDYWTNVEETWLFDRRHWTHTSRICVLETGKCVRMETVVDPL